MHREDIHLDGYRITFDKALSSIFSQLPAEFTRSLINELRERPTLSRNPCYTKAWWVEMPPVLAGAEKNSKNAA